MYKIFIFLSLALVLMFNEIKGEMYNNINGFVIEDQHFADIRGDYRKPNETEPHLFIETLKNREGVLLSVGTLRSLIAFSLGDFSHLIMVDIDPIIREYNRQHLDFIKSLLDKYPDSPESQRLEYQNSENFNTYTKSFSGSFYWGDDEKWLKITNAIQDHRVYVTSADFLNWESNEKLKEALATFGDTPFTFDISNVIDYTGSSYNQLADTLYYLVADSGCEEFKEIERYCKNYQQATEPLSIPFFYDDYRQHLVLLTSLSLVNKSIPNSCLPNFLGSQPHGNFLSFKYYSSDLSSFLKFLRACVGFEHVEGVDCSDISVELKEVIDGQRFDLKYILSWPTSK